MGSGPRGAAWHWKGKAKDWTPQAQEAIGQGQEKKEKKMIVNILLMVIILELAVLFFAVYALGKVLLEEKK